MIQRYGGTRRAAVSLGKIYLPASLCRGCCRTLAARHCFHERETSQRPSGRFAANMVLLPPLRPFPSDGPLGSNFTCLVPGGVPVIPCPPGRTTRAFLTACDCAQFCAHLTGTERKSLNYECGWKGGDRGGLAGRGKKWKKRWREKKTLDTDRPSHGRS